MKTVLFVFSINNIFIFGKFFDLWMFFFILRFFFQWKFKFCWNFLVRLRDYSEILNINSLENYLKFFLGKFIDENSTELN